MSVGHLLRRHGDLPAATAQPSVPIAWAILTSVAITRLMLYSESIAIKEVRLNSVKGADCCFYVIAYV